MISDLLRDVGEATEDTGYLRFVMTERILVSGRHHALCAVDATRRALEAGHRIESAAALLETIVEHVADTMDGIADRVAQALDEVEEQVLSDSATDRVKTSAGCGAPAAACTGSCRACGSCFTGSSTGISTI